MKKEYCVKVQNPKIGTRVLLLRYRKVRRNGSMTEIQQEYVGKEGVISSKQILSDESGCDLLWIMVEGRHEFAWRKSNLRKKRERKRTKRSL